MVRGQHWSAVLLGFAILYACDVDPVPPDETPTGGTSGSAGAAGSAGNAGNAGNGGSLGGTGTGGNAGSSGGSGGAGQAGATSGGTAGAGGTSSGGEGGESGGEAGSGGEGGQPPEPLTVNGLLLLDQAPVAGVAVTVAGRTVITSTEGRFTAANVMPPYDVTAVLPSQELVSSFIGVRRANPVLSFVTGAAPNSVTLRGSVTGGAGFPNPVEHSAEIVFMTEHTVRRRLFDPTGSTYEETFTYAGPAAANATVVVLQMRRDGTGVVDYTGHARRTLAIAANGTFDVNLDLAPVSERTVTGTIQAPQGYGSFSLLLRTDHVLPISGASVAGSNFSILVPVGLPSPPELSVSASAADGSVTGQTLAIPDASTMQAFSFPPAPALVAPADATTGVDDSTVFSFTPGFAGVHRVIWSVGSWMIQVTTDERTARIPSGVPLPADTNGQWFVLGQSGEVDDLLTNATLPNAVEPEFGASSAARSFRTAN